MEEPLISAAIDESALDHALMARIGRGDEAAFRQLIERHQHPVVGTVAKMLGDTADAEDIAQQVFLRIWKHAKRYQARAKFTTYLFTITRHLVFNEIRRRKRRREVSADEREENSHQQIEDRSEYQPDQEMIQAELQQAVDRAIEALPEAQRMAVVLRRYKQLPYEEIAEILELSLPAVKSLIFRARVALKESLRSHLEP